LEDSSGRGIHSLGLIEFSSTHAVLGNLVTNVGSTVMVTADGRHVLRQCFLMVCFAFFDQALAKAYIPQAV